MRVANWKAKEVFEQIAGRADENANAVMDDVVIDAKRRCKVGTISRPGGWGTAYVAFIPETGRNRGQFVDFWTSRRWYGREPGDLRDTIRRVNKHGSGKIRVYAGTFKIYWAFMVERGTEKTPAQAFLRPAFEPVKATVIQRIKQGA